MTFFQSFSLAVRSIWGSKIRSLLTMLGIIIGVGAVIVIIGLGNGMQSYMTDSFDTMGTNLITVNVFGRGASSSRYVEDRDMYTLVEEYPQYLTGVSPNVSVSGGVKIDNETIYTTSVSGVGEDYADIRRMDMAQGRFLQYVDVSRRQNVCVVGSYVNNEHFGGKALGGVLRVGGVNFSIVGVLDETADSTKSSYDDVVLMPYTVAMKLSQTGSINSFYFSSAGEDSVDYAMSVIKSRLYEVFQTSDAYMVISMAQMLEIMTQMLDVMIVILTAIAAISLVVGGIGIMNIMLVSVSERTREIGIRKSLGAKQRDIMRQFVIEAATTSALGGVIGIGLGYALSSIATGLIIAILQVDMAVTPTMDAIVKSFGISVGIGILFGYLPAKKAARLNPIDALRYD